MLMFFENMNTFLKNINMFSEKDEYPFWGKWKMFIFAE